MSHWTQGEMGFQGTTYNTALDRQRLTGQMLAVYKLMRDGLWRTLDQIREVAGGSETGVSARLRDLRKAQFGGHTVEGRRVAGGLWEYRVERRHG